MVEKSCMLKGVKIILKDKDFRVSDKPQDIGTDSQSQRLKDVVDYNHELAGGENGRIKRFSVDGPTYLNTEEQEKRKSRERQFTSMLAYMLEHDGN
ncbi:MAG: hypothetical protein AAF988_04905 [Pseudomonadota bacterium]